MRVRKGLEGSELVKLGGDFGPKKFATCRGWASHGHR